MTKKGHYVGTSAMAEALGCTPETVRVYCEGGLFPGAKRLPGGRSDWRIPRKFFLDAKGGSPSQQPNGKQGE